MIGLANTPVLETERLILRAPTGDDWPAWRDFHLSDRAQYIGGGSQMTERNSWRAFGHVIGHWVMRGFGMFVITEKGGDAALGITGPWFPAGWPEREVGWSIWHPAGEGRGIASEAARAALDHVFNDLGWDTAVSYIDAENTRSIALAERLGARLDADAPSLDTGADEINHVYRHRKGSA
ncbi:GNAT family N-acetyltransferase [Paracoccus tegillarcae]|uniref:N-acetyltransferase n=1 Tax=Paracoccus tegillarcae TaxID=1529068 RepID=A0A2K9EDW9_9RHOB|nr:GNAT family N-acetyltransferase [Paracoccus tegillarcae]AUH32499.1 N-acetyltransferase [Paracoccus tegillarcae]